MKPLGTKILGSGGKQSSCSGKRRHSQASARKAALIMAERHREPFEEYRCIHCDYWHVGHPLYWRGGRREAPGWC